MSAAAAALLLTGCPASGEPPKSAAPKPPPAERPEDAAALPRATVLLKDAFGGTQRVQVEVAATPDTRQRGLMWRESLADGQGMLFVFPQSMVQSFWMKNTLIPLDMLFLSEGKVVGVVERAEPKTLTPRSVGIPSRYVLEVPGGWVAKVGVTVGAEVELQGLGAVQVR